MTRLELGPACRRHRGTLLELVDRQERNPAVERALEHLTTCRRCEDEVTRLALTIQALRRIGQAAASVAPSDAAWPRLRDHLERSQQQARETAWRWRLNLGGVLASTLIVGVLVGPLAIHVSLDANGGHEPSGLSAAEIARAAQETESAFLAARTRRAEDAPAAGDPALAIRTYPDGLSPDRKEVPPRTSGLGSAAR